MWRAPGATGTAAAPERALRPMRRAPSHPGSCAKAHWGNLGKAPTAGQGDARLRRRSDSSGPPVRSSL